MLEAEKTELWKRRFFEAQAAAEEFITARHGDDGIDDWIIENARIAATLLASEEPDDTRKTRHFSERLLRQLKLYDSEIDRVEEGPETVLVNRKCGILQYRHSAEKRGVKLTFEKPCGYCRKLNSQIFHNYTRGKQISCQLQGDGCVWRLQND